MRTEASAGLRVLLIEDSPDYALLVREELTELSPGWDIAHRSSLANAEGLLRDEWADCILLDLSLADAQGLEGVAAVRELAPASPIVVLSGDDSEVVAIEAVHEGAQDYLVKRHCDGHLVSRSVRYAVERKRVELELAHRALHDALTDLPNRTLFLDRLDLALARNRRVPTDLAVLFCDLDRFKVVNDSLGHELGDRLLIEVARRLNSLVRPSDTVSRFGGDEFVVLCDPVDDERQALLVAERLSAGLVEPFAVDGQELYVGASLGIALAGEVANDAKSLLRAADRAMYQAKRYGTRYEVSREATVERPTERLSLETQLHRALEREELRLVYQPEIDLRDQRILGVEALIRWQHPERGLVAPAEFLPLAEETGLIVPMGEWTIHEAVRQLGRWREAGLCHPDMQMSVNLSMRQLVDRELIARVESALRDAQVPARALCFEVTESVVAADPQQAGERLEALRALGVSLSLDDFGTGLSTLSVLDRYPLDTLKIDRSFVARFEAGLRAKRIFAAVLGVARAAGLTAVAEGVETRTQLEEVARMGCDAVQGFFLSRPETALDVQTGLLHPPAQALV